ncbi:MAG TPA: CPXCG motif-containing cysteine-rich protein [Pyrinomonadaceae bacterium]
METEHFFTCPYCWQEISMLLDASVTDQTYIEDCEVCCRPIKIRYFADNGEITEFEAESIDE